MSTHNPTAIHVMLGLRLSGRLMTSRVRAVSSAINKALSKVSEDADGFRGIILVREGDPRITADHCRQLLQQSPYPGLFLNLAAQDIVRSELQGEARLIDIGVYPTAADGRAERLFAFVHPELPEPELEIVAVEGNCPEPVSSFVGRHSEAATLQGLLLEKPWVTITGAPGVGKTSLALHIARSLIGESKDGVWWFSLAGRSSFEDVVQSIGRACGLLGLSALRTVADLAGALANREALLVLDGCDLYGKELSELAGALFRHAPRITLLASANRRLGVPREVEYRLQPFQVRQPKEERWKDLLFDDALRLFLARAMEAGALIPENQASITLVAEICWSLDGLPLAIELAASALGSTGLRRLHDRVVGAHEASRVTGPVLERAATASHRLLSESAKRLLSRLSLFEETWSPRTLSDARFVGDEPFVEANLELLSRGWITEREDGRFRMLTPLRDFVRSLDTGNTPLRDFTTAMIDLHGSATERFVAQGDPDAELQLDFHHADLIRCLELAFSDPRFGVERSRLMEYAIPYWIRRNLLGEAEQWCERIIALEQANRDALRARMMLGIIRYRVRRTHEAIDDFKRALALSLEQDFKAAEATALTNLGLAYTDTEDYVAAISSHREALAACREANDALRLPNMLSNAVHTLLTAARESAADQGRQQELLSEALRVLSEAESLNPGSPMIGQGLLHNRAALERLKGNTQRAFQLFCQAVKICDDHKMRHEACQAALELSEMSLEAGQHALAAKLLGLGVQLRKEAGRQPAGLETLRLGRLHNDLARALGHQRLERLLRYGAKLDLAEVASLSLAG